MKFPPLQIALAVACLLCMETAEAATFTLNTQTTGASTTITGNNAIFREFDTGSGSGVYTALFREQTNTSVESGYNYGGASTVPFDQKNGVGTLDLDLGDVPVVNVGGQNYLQLVFDLNEPVSDSFIQLTEFRIYIQSDSSVGNPSHTPYVTTEAGLSSLGTLVYNLDSNADNTLNITTKTGSGNTDMEILMPFSLFQSYGNLDNVYVWMKFANNDAGFEEVATFKGAGMIFASLPEPQTVLGGSLVAFILAGSHLRRRPRRKSA